MYFHNTTYNKENIYLFKLNNKNTIERYEDVQSYQ